MTVFCRALLVVALYIVLMKLAHVVGLWVPALALGIAGLGSAWLKHTESSAALFEDFDAALRDCGLSDKDACGYMGVSQPQLSRQRVGLEMLSASRMANLPPEFHVALAKRRLARYGAFTVLEEGALAHLVAAVDSLARNRQALLALASERPGKVA